MYHSLRSQCLLQTFLSCQSLCELPEQLLLRLSEVLLRRKYSNIGGDIGRNVVHAVEAKPWFRRASWVFLRSVTRICAHAVIFRCVNWLRKGCHAILRFRYGILDVKHSSSLAWDRCSIIANFEILTRVSHHIELPDVITPDPVASRSPIGCKSFLCPQLSTILR